MTDEHARARPALATTAPASTAPVIVARGLTRRYGRTVALDRVDMTLDHGVVGLLGPNGAGKTTLLSILATVASPDSGTLSVLGLDPGDQRERLRIRRRLGFVPQHVEAHPHFKVADFIDYVAILKEIVDRRERREEVARVLAATDLEAVAGKRLRALSGGTRRRVVLAQALLGSPDLLILDEPIVGLDPEQRLRFRALLSDLPQSPFILLSTHQADDVSAICTAVVVLVGGAVRFAGTPDELAAVARGHVWLAPERDLGARLAWRGGDGAWRHVGECPPAGAEPITPTVEDGYLLLSGAPVTDEG